MSNNPSSAFGSHVLVISGPSGSGKTTIVAELEKHAPVKLIKSISATTRPAREHEIDGDHYHFLSQQEFDQKREAGEFLEYAEVHRSGYWYGTLKSEVTRAHQAGGWSLLEIDVEGALHVMQEYPEAVTIFVTTPSEEVFETRLRDRGTEDEEIIQRRLETARRELENASRYKYIIVNDNLERAVAEIQTILVREASLPVKDCPSA